MGLCQEGCSMAWVTGVEAGGYSPAVGGWRCRRFSFPLAGGSPAFGELIQLQFPFGPL